jgi:hypothetical protein
MNTVIDIRSARSRRAVSQRRAPRRLAGDVDPLEVARRSASGEPLLTTDELCRALRVSDREVRRWRREESPVPCIPVTERSVRFFLADVIAWRAAHAGPVGQAS